MTREDFQRAALDYLSKRISTTENLRRVLERTIVRKRVDEETATEWRTLIADVVATAARAGLVDDGLFARARGNTLARKGASRRAIVNHLSSRGVDRDLAKEATTGVDDERQAVLYARRKRIGPFRSPPDESRRDRDIAALARAGFSVDLAIRVVEGRFDPDEIMAA